MSLSLLSSAQLQRVIELIKEKETLQAKLTQIEASLVALEKGHVSRGEVPGKGGRRRRRRRRVALKDGILKNLLAAGKKGMTVKELAASLRANPASVSVWFYTTGKKTKGIRKVGKAKFAYVE
jgi:hypothetical protein